MRPLLLVLVLSFGVAGCSQQTVSSPPSNAVLALPPAHAAVTLTTIYSFKSSPDGQGPVAGVTLFAGKFYGTTLAGGTSASQAGTVFDVQKDGTEHVLHSFTESPDGGGPGSGLTNLNNSALYGTTRHGGDRAGSGTVYEIKGDSTVSYRVVYTFKGSPDGRHPVGDLTAFKGTLFGTTLDGGTATKGTVFEVHTDGTERVLDSFTGTPDGDSPHGGLVELNGSLYGTTELGGANNMGCVFKVQTDGTESVLYSFKGGSGDGASPLAGLTVLNGVLYGVTREGGANDYGTVFAVKEDGTESVLHSFNGSDGKYPYASLTVLKGLLYGTTRSGGAQDFGTIFEVHPGGAFRRLHAFNGTDGRYPFGSLTPAAGNALVGTTRDGGAANKGTVFLLQL
jgi:uncharacterized repeat protein (TIGR03803 family)